MGDIAQGVGFDPSNLTAGLPSYEDLVSKLGDSTSQKLQQASQALQTAQLTHSLLSKFKPYRDLTKNLSESIFDPVKAEFKQATGNLVKKIAGKFNPTGEGEGGISGKMLSLLGDNPEDLIKLVKNPKKFGKSLLNRAIENSNLTAEEKQLAQAAAEGKISGKTAGKALLNRVIDQADIPDEAKALAKSAAEGRVGKAEGQKLVSSLVDKSDLPDDVKALAKSSIESGALPSKAQTQKLIESAIDKAPLPAEAKLLGKSLASGKVPGMEDAKGLVGNMIDNSKSLTPEQKSLAKAAMSGSRDTFIEQAKNNMATAVDNSDIDPDVKVAIKKALSGADLSAEGKSAMAEFLDSSNMGSEAKTLTKALITGDKGGITSQATSLLNGVIDSSESPAAVKTLAKSVIKGRAPTLAEGKAAMDSVIPDSVKARLPEFEDVAKIPATVTAKAEQFAKLPEVAADVAEKRIGKMPSELVNNLRQAGVSDSEIAANADKAIDFAKIYKERPLRLLDPSEITADAPDFDLADAQKAYRDSKYISSLKTPAAESGAARGDSTIARVLQANSDEPVSETKIGPYKPKSRAQIKQEAKARKVGKPVQEEAGPATEPEAKPGVQTEQTINQNREVADPALQSFVDESAKIPPKPTAVSEIEPAAEPTSAKPKVKAPVPEEEIGLGDIASGGLEAANLGVGAFGLAQSIEQKNKSGEEIQGTQLAAQGASEGADAAEALATKTGIGATESATAESGSVVGGAVAKKTAAGELQETTDESLAEDEDPLGAAVSGILEVATLATMLAGIFAPKPKAPVVVGGYQSGV
jgi:hypothetical protein